MSKSDINHKVGDVIRVYDDVRDEWSDQIVLTPGFEIQDNRLTHSEDDGWDEVMEALGISPTK